MAPLVSAIECFAPGAHRLERETHFYNYLALPLYRGPLLALLEVLARRPPLQGEDVPFGREVLLRLKAFYDPRGRLPLDAALGDWGLKRKFLLVFKIFYGIDRDAGLWEKAGDSLKGHREDHDSHKPEQPDI